MKFPYISKYDSWCDEINKKISGILKSDSEDIATAISLNSQRVIYNAKEYIYSPDMTDYHMTNSPTVQTYSGWFRYHDSSTKWKVKYIVCRKHTAEIAGLTMYLKINATGVFDVIVSFPETTNDDITGVTIDGYVSIKVDVPENAQYITIELQNNTGTQLWLHECRFNIYEDNAICPRKIYSSTVGQFTFSYADAVQSGRLELDGSKIDITEYPVLASLLYTEAVTFDGTYPDIYLPNINDTLSRGPYLWYAPRQFTDQYAKGPHVFTHKHIDSGHTHSVATTAAGTGYGSSGSIGAAPITAGSTIYLSDGFANVGSPQTLSGGTIRTANETRFQSLLLKLTVGAI